MAQLQFRSKTDDTVDEHTLNASLGLGVPVSWTMPPYRIRTHAVHSHGCEL